MSYYEQLLEAGGAELLCRMLYTSPCFVQAAVVQLLRRGVEEEGGGEEDLLKEMMQAEFAGALTAARQALAARKVPAGPAGVDALLSALEDFARSRLG